MSYEIQQERRKAQAWRRYYMLMADGRNAERDGRTEDAHELFEAAESWARQAERIANKMYARRNLQGVK